MQGVRMHALRIVAARSFVGRLTVNSAESFSEARSRLQLAWSSRLSSDNGATPRDFTDEELRRRILNRLLYRSRQRGFLELDLLLGKWVDEHIHTMDEAGITALSDVLDLENPYLWKWLTGQEQPPDTINSNPVFIALHMKIMNNLNICTAPETRAKPGQSWVRGWDDRSGHDGPKYGSQ